MNARNALRGYVRTLRTHLNVSQEELARLIGLSKNSYSEWERGISEDMRAVTYIRAVMALNGDLLALGGLVQETADEMSGEIAALHTLKAATAPKPSDDFETRAKAYAANWMRQVADLMDQGVPPTLAVRRATELFASGDGSGEAPK